MELDITEQLNRTEQVQGAGNFFEELFLSSNDGYWFIVCFIFLLSLTGFAIRKMWPYKISW